MKKLAPVIGLLVLVLLVIQAGYMLSASRSEKRCERLVAFAHDLYLVDKIKRQASMAISSENNLKVMAGVGGVMYSHELPNAFSKLELDIDWKSIGVDGAERYIAFEGDWWELNGSVNRSKINGVSLGGGPRQYVMMDVGEGTQDTNSANEERGLAYSGQGVFVYCK
jgi:hypothetical protein